MEGYTLLGVLVIINIISIGLTLTLTQWLGSKSIEAVSQADVELFIFVFVNLSNACIIAMLGGCIKLRRKRDKGHGGKLHFVGEYVGLYLFGIGTIILSILELSAVAQCFPVVNKVIQNLPHFSNVSHSVNDELENISFSYTVFTLLSVFKSICILLQLTFLIRFKTHRAGSVQSKLSIMMLLIANATMYIVTFLQKTKKKLNVKSESLADYIQSVIPDEGQEILVCLNESRSLQKTADEAEPYLYPFEMEFCLTAGGLLFSFYAMKKKKSVNQQCQTDNDVVVIAGTNTGETEELDQDHICPKSDSKVSSVPELGETSSETDTTKGGDINLVDLSKTAPEQDTDSVTSELSMAGMNCSRRRHFKFAFNLGMFISLILLLLEGVYAYDTSNKIRNKLVLGLWIFRLLYILSMLATSAWCAAIFVKTLPLQWKRLNTNHYLLLTSATGEFIYLFFGILAATTVFNEHKVEKMLAYVGNSNHTSDHITEMDLVAENALSFVIHSIDILQIATQTYILIVATTKNDFDWGAINSTVLSRRIAKEILYYLCICNATIWITNSFIEGHYKRAQDARILVFGKTGWTGIAQSTYPLALFYRYHSVHMCMKVIDKVKRKPKS